MSENVGAQRPFRWTKQREKAALLVAQDELSNDRIAAEAGITDRQLLRWKRHPTFAARVAEYIEVACAELRARSIAELQNRVDAINDRWERMRQLIADRAEAYAGQAPGAGTGLLVPKPLLLKVYDAGPAPETPDEAEDPADPGEAGETLFFAKRSVTAVAWAVDTGLLHELREHEKIAAQMLGQWTDKSDVTSGGQPLLIKAYVGVDLDRV